MGGWGLTWLVWFGWNGLRVDSERGVDNVVVKWNLVSDVCILIFFNAWFEALFSFDSRTGWMLLMSLLFITRSYIEVEFKTPKPF